MDNKLLDSVLSYLNEGVVNEILKIKVNNHPSISSEEKLQAKKDEKELVTSINKIISKLKSDSKFKKKVKECGEKYLKELEDDMNADKSYDDSYVDDLDVEELDDEDRAMLKMYTGETKQYKITKEDINDAKLPPIKCSVFEELHCDYESDNKLHFSGILEVLNGTQMQCVIFGWILHDITDILKKSYSNIYSKFDFEYGDGDEGCLYITYMLKR